jgi:hypothetical protein
MRPMKRTGSQFMGGSRKWYLAGGSPLPVAVYVPKGAADLAASYVNLANPGTYNAAPGTAPTFAAATGWTFAAASSQYLDTGLVMASNTYSVVVRFSGAVNNSGRLFGYSSGTAILSIVPDNGTVARYSYANNVDVAPDLAAGVLAITPTNGYRNGTSEASMAGYSGTNARSMYIGAINSGSASLFFSGNILALAIYNATLTAPQVAAISAAMALL